MRPLKEIQARLQNLAEVNLNQATVAKRLKIDQRAVSEIANDKRKLSYEEALKLIPMLWPDDGLDAATEGQPLITEETPAALRALLPLLQVPDHVVELVVEQLPALVEEMRIAAQSGDDPEAAARSAARLLSRQGRSAARTQ